MAKSWCLMSVDAGTLFLRMASFAEGLPIPTTHSVERARACQNKAMVRGDGGNPHSSHLDRTHSAGLCCAVIAIPTHWNRT